MKYIKFAPIFLGLALFLGACSNNAKKQDPIAQTKPIRKVQYTCPMDTNYCQTNQADAQSAA